MLLKPFCFFLFSLVRIALAVEENYRYFVDPVSCKEDGVKLMLEWMQQAIVWAEMTSEVLKTEITDDRIRTQYKRIFNSLSSKQYTQSYYQNLARFTPYSGSLPQWQAERNQYDVEIHCNVDYIVKNNGYYPEHNTPYVDTVQNAPIEKNSVMLRLKRGITSLIAITSPRNTMVVGQIWKPTSPEVITINPIRMKQYRWRKPTFDEDRIKKAMHPRMLNWLKIKAPSIIGTWKQVDLLDTPALTMLHEMTHTVSGALSDDGDANHLDCYGWDKILDNSFLGFRTADNLAYFAMLVDLIQNYGYDVDESGSLMKIE